MLGRFSDGLPHVRLVFGWFKTVFNDFGDQYNDLRILFYNQRHKTVLIYRWNSLWDSRPFSSSAIFLFFSFFFFLLSLGRLKCSSFSS